MTLGAVQTAPTSPGQLRDVLQALRAGVDAKDDEAAGTPALEARRVVAGVLEQLARGPRPAALDRVRRASAGQHTVHARKARGAAILAGFSSGTHDCLPRSQGCGAIGATAVAQCPAR